jgi:uncharacterized protein
MSLTDEKYLVLTTFRRDGTPVSMPVWVVGLDDEAVGFWTSSGRAAWRRGSGLPTATGACVGRHYSST